MDAIDMLARIASSAIEYAMRVDSLTGKLEALTGARYVPERTCVPLVEVLDTTETGHRLAKFCSACGEQISLEYSEVTEAERGGVPNYCPYCGAKVV